MAFSNKMTVLLNKIERQLGVRGINLPEELGKDQWVQIIDEDTLPVFSRFFPHAFTIYLDQNHLSRRPGEECTYLIDENDIPGNVEIIGVKDLSWEKMSNTASGATTNLFGYGSYDGFCCMDFEDFAMTQMMADTVSLFNNGIYLDFTPPNKVKLSGSVNQNIAMSLNKFPVEVHLKHPKNLQTIEPTKMNWLERLAKDDIATFLYGELKYYDDLEVLFGGNVQLHLDTLQDAMSDRDNVIDYLDTNYVSAANKNQPLMFSTT